MQQQRTIIVLGVAVITAGIAAYGVYRALQERPVLQVEVETVPVVVATTDVPVGTLLTAGHLSVAAWPTRSLVSGAFATVEEVVGRGVISAISANEPVTTKKVASAGEGAGLPPPGKVSVAVPVNDVVSVAGFVVPGSRVDVLLSVQDDGTGRSEPRARTVVSNVPVLTSGMRFDPQAGESERAAVVTLAVDRRQAELIKLGETRGRLSLALRNPSDTDETQTPGVTLRDLMEGPPPPAPPPAPRRTAPRPAPVATPPPPPPPPGPYTVEAIRGIKKSTEEVLD